MQNNNQSSIILEIITLAVLLLTLVLLLSRIFLTPRTSNPNGLPGGGGQVSPASQQAHITSSASNVVQTSIPGLVIEIQRV